MVEEEKSSVIDPTRLESDADVPPSSSTNSVPQQNSPFSDPSSAQNGGESPPPDISHEAKEASPTDIPAETSPLIPNDSQPEAPQPDLSIAAKRAKKRLSRKRSRRNAALRNRQNTSVYASNLPLSTTAEQMYAHFTKCGIILPNPTTGRPSIKLYVGEDGIFKGTALVTYALRPSVENAIELLDGTFLDASTGMQGKPMSVQEANFDHKRQRTDDPNAKDGDISAKNDNQSTQHRKAIPVKQLIQEALTWDDDAPRQAQATAARIVILKNVFDSNPLAEVNYEEIREDMEDGCGACGGVEKITPFEKSPVGAVAVKFDTVHAALKCVKVMDGRWYDERKLEAEFYDGSSDYRYKESESDRKQRDKEWEQWLDGGEKDKQVKDTTNVIKARKD